MYMGATTLATPMPAPPTSRQNMSHSTLGGKAVPTALSAKSTAAMSMTRRRPKVSASWPANQAPTAEPIRAIDTTNAIIPEPRSKVWAMAVLAPLITAESKPKRNPPRAAVAASRTTRPVR